MIGLNKIGLNQVQLNQLYLNTLCACQKSSGGDGFPRLPGDVTRWSFKGLTNEQMSKNPRLEDADHKGRFLTFKNFAWGEMSGVGGYTQNYNYSAWKLALDRAETTKTGHSFNVTSVTSTVVAFYYQSGSGQEPFTVKSQIVRVSGLTDGQSIKYGTGKKSVLVIESDGIYTLPPFDFAAKGIWYGFSFGKIQESCNITLEQLPYYPGFIIGDGVDDCAVTEKNLDFEDTYTVYTAFIPFQEDPARNMVLCGKNNNKDFYMNYSTLNSINFYSSSKAATVKLSNGFNLIICKRTTDKMIIKNLLTNVSVEIDANAVSENPGLYYLWRSLNNASSHAKAAIAGQVICNGHFTTDEEDTKVLNWYKKEYPWLFFDQAWTVVGKSNEDTDRATIANITGNGNNLVLSNFGFAGNSGYGEWPAIVLNSGLSTNQPYGTLYFTESDYASSITEYLGSFNFKFRVRELPDGGNFTIRGYREDSPTENAVITKIYNANGVYELSYDDNNVPIRLVFYNGKSSSNRSSFYIDIIPDHEGYLVTDGVDDKVESSPFTLNKDWTIVGNWTMLSNIPSNCGIIKVSSMFLYNSLDGVTIYFAGGPIKIQSKSINAFCSDGRIYLNDWTEILKPDAQIASGGSKSSLNIASYSANFTKMAFKNLAIYDGKNLSKDDCIKAYNYLQTLKAK